MKIKRNILVSSMIKRNILVSLIMIVSVSFAANAQHSFDITNPVIECPIQKTEDTQGCGRRREKVPHTV